MGKLKQNNLPRNSQSCASKQSLKAPYTVFIQSNSAALAVIARHQRWWDMTVFSWNLLGVHCVPGTMLDTLCTQIHLPSHDGVNHPFCKQGTWSWESLHNSPLVIQAPWQSWDMKLSRLIPKLLGRTTLLSIPSTGQSGMVELQG